jgi:UDPglucose 6-dehydrogenase
MEIAIICLDHVDLVSEACFADFGHDVDSVDKDQGKIDRLNANVMPIYELGLDALS